jgi:hypothetical protein
MVTRENVIDRLTQFGYIPTEADHAQIDFEMEWVINYVKNYCNITDIPEILDVRIIDRICSFYLFNKKNSGQLTGFDYEPAIKQLKEGDTTIAYAVGQGEDTPENRFDALVKQLERGFDKWITPYRRLRW